MDCGMCGLPAFPDLLFGEESKQCCKCKVRGKSGDSKIKIEHIVDYTPQEPVSICDFPQCDGLGKEVATCVTCRTRRHRRCTQATELVTFGEGVFACNQCTRKKSPGIQCGSCAGSEHATPRASGLCRAIPPLAETPTETLDASRPWYTAERTQPLLASPRVSPNVGTLRYVRAEPARLPEFSGNTCEDVEQFLVQCESRLARHEVPYEEWVERVWANLQGAAKEWWSIWGRAAMPWEEFADNLRHRFEAKEALADCQAQFYGEKQRDTESTEKFIARKIQLFRRISPTAAPEEALSSVTPRLRLELQPFLTTMDGERIESYVRRAVAAEKAVNQLTKGRAASMRQTDDRPRERDAAPPLRMHQQTLPPPPLPAIMYPTRGDRPVDRPPQCHTCQPPAFHWHRDCPVRNASGPPPGNA